MTFCKVVQGRGRRPVPSHTVTRMNQDPDAAEDVSPDRLVAMDCIFAAYAEPVRPEPALMRVVIDWPRLETVVDDREDPVEVAERLIADHFAVPPGAIQVSMRRIVDPDQRPPGIVGWH